MTIKAVWAKSSKGAEPARPTRIIVIDDDVGMQRVLSEYLEGHGIEVSVAAGRSDMTQLLAEGCFSLVLLDLRLGREDGLDLLRELRAGSNLPVIIISGDRHDEIDRVVGLELGADDYLAKPFGLRELLARIRNVLRRAGAGRVESIPDPAKGRSLFAGWTLDRRQRLLTDPGGTTVSLTKGEYALLVTFLDAPQRPLSREHLLQSTRVHEDIIDRSIDVQILRLRRKLEIDPASPKMIRTKRGVGYVFAVKVETTR